MCCILEVLMILVWGVLVVVGVVFIVWGAEPFAEHLGAAAVWLQVSSFCLVALGVGAWIAPLPFNQRVMRYALFGLPIGMVATGFVWDGEINRLEGLFLIGLYVLYVALIWWIERKPPALGETGELEEASEKLATEQAKGIQHRVGKELRFVLGGDVLAVL
jgi:cation:H+ antiporter